MTRRGGGGEEEEEEEEEKEEEAAGQGNRDECSCLCVYAIACHTNAHTVNASPPVQHNE
jgi:hypothetical protein